MNYLVDLAIAFDFLKFVKVSFFVSSVSISNNYDIGDNKISFETSNGRGELSLKYPLDMTLHRNDKVVVQGVISEINMWSPDQFTDGDIRHFEKTGAQAEAEAQSAWEAKNIAYKQEKERQEAKRREDQIRQEAEKHDASIKREAEQKDRENRVAVEDAQSAQKMGVDLETYKLGKDRKDGAHSACTRAVISQANWDGAKSDWFGDFSWFITGHKIHISGNDVSMKNGFGNGRHINYECEYDLNEHEAIVLRIE